MNKKYQFYYPNGNEIESVDEFVQYYNGCYFIECEDKVSNVRKNSKYAEQLIEKILLKEPNEFTDADVILMMAWKIGKITHSESNNKLVLHSDWQNALGEYPFVDWNGEPIKRYGEESNIEIDVKSIAEYIRKNGRKLSQMIAAGEMQNAIEELKQQNWQGIGAVYLITLLYFISNTACPGKCPIYDRFAMTSLLAIKENKKIGEVIEFEALPDKENEKFSEKVAERMKEYVGLLNEIFGDEYSKTRDVDRALWVYGHLFRADK